MYCQYIDYLESISSVKYGWSLFTSAIQAKSFKLRFFRVCMGLTIHYTLKMYGQNPQDARYAVDSLHEKASRLWLKDVGRIVELEGKQCRPEHFSPDNPSYWLARRSGRINYEQPEALFEYPDYLIAFDAHPAEGSESAIFGLGRYESDQIADSQLQNWSFGSFCKTQYASDPRYGGVENFVKAHLGVITVLDYAHELGILERVDDEGAYWTNRNVRQLAEDIGGWNEMIADMVESLKEQYNLKRI